MKFRPCTLAQHPRIHAQNPAHLDPKLLCLLHGRVDGQAAVCSGADDACVLRLVDRTCSGAELAEEELVEAAVIRDIGVEELAAVDWGNFRA